MDDDAAALTNEPIADPLGPLEAAVGDMLHGGSPAGPGSNAWQETYPSQAPDDKPQLDPGRQHEFESELTSAIAHGEVGHAAAVKAKLMGIAPFEPSTFRLRRASQLMDVGAPSDGGFGPFFQMARDFNVNPDLVRIQAAYASAKYGDARRGPMLSGPALEEARSEYAQFVVNYRVGTYEVFDGNGSSDWTQGGDRLTVYTPDGDYAFGRPSAEALQALQEAGYKQLEKSR